MEQYTTPVLELIQFETEDVITTSTGRKGDPTWGPEV